MSAKGLRAALAGGLLLALPAVLLSPPWLTGPLRVVTASAAVPLLWPSGQEVRREGTVLRGEDGEYHVADECSGARKLWASLALAVGLAQLRALGARPTAWLVVAAALAALLGNALRVAALFYLEIVLLWRSAYFHDGAGLASFALVVAAVFAAARAVGRPRPGATASAS
jgi:exosortase